MNQRIRELADQALFESDFDDEQNIKITMDIFAELVVRECLDILEDEDTHDVYGQPIRLATIRIKKLFEVEL